MPPCQGAACGSPTEIPFARPDSVSPLLQVSLLIVFLLWVIPITWALASKFGTLPGLISALRGLSEYFHSASEVFTLTEEDHLLVKRRKRLDDQYMDLQDDVIRLRALLARSLDIKEDTEKKIRRLNAELQGPEVRISDSKTAEELKELAPEAKLAQLQRKLEEIDQKIDSLRAELQEKMTAIQRSYTIKLELIARGKAPAVRSNPNKQLDGVATAAKARFEMLEQAVETRELRAYGEAGQSKNAEEFHEFGKTIWHLPIDRLDVAELRQLAKLIGDVGSDLKRWIREREAKEESLKQKVVACEAEYDAWLRKQAEAVPGDQPRFVSEAEANQVETQILAGNHKVMLQESTKQTHDLKLLLLGLSKRKEEILIRAAELKFGNIDFGTKE